MWNALRSDFQELVSTVTTADASAEVDEPSFDLGDDATFTTPLECAPVEFTDAELAQLLQSNALLQAQYDRLVPDQVSAEDFWQRYYYRLELDASTPSPLAGIRNLLGGAVSSLAHGLTDGDHRPPFVMNTAVDEDDDEEEEELGWDDDDDDEEEAGSGEHQIEFTDTATDQLKEELRVALEERDLLHDTTEMLKKEIAVLKESPAEAASEQIEQLKMQLFEKESELAAYQSGSMDVSRDETNDEAMELRKMMQIKDAKIAELEQALNEAHNSLDSTNKELETATASLDQATGEVASLEKQLSEQATSTSDTTELESTVASLREEVATLKESCNGLEQSLSEAQAEKSSSEQSMTIAVEKVATLEQQVQALQSELTSSKARVAELENDLSEAQTKAAEKHEEDAGGLSTASPDTMSTGVKVDDGALKTEDEEGGWDDDW